MSFPQYIHNQPQCESRSDHGQISTWTLWALRQWFSVWSSASLPSLTVTGRGTDQVRDEAVKIMYNITLISQLTMTTPSPGTSPPCQPPSWVISPRYLPSHTWLTSPPLSQSTGVLPALTTTTLSSQSALPGRTRLIWLSRQLNYVNTRYFTAGATRTVQSSWTTCTPLSTKRSVVGDMTRWEHS